MLALLAALLCAAPPVHSQVRDDELSGTEALAGYRNRNREVFIYIGGLTDGLRNSNALAQVMQRDRMFCVPAGATLTTDQMMDILESYLRKSPSEQRKSVAMSLPFALSQALPCGRRS